MADVHIVKKGETLSIIAGKHGLTLAKVLSLNPTLKNNPHRILPGMPIRIAPLVVSTDPRLARLVFNGTELQVISIEGDKVVAKYPAVSGLPPHAPRLKELIDKDGRDDLNIETDYTETKYQDVKDAGPIQAGDYALALKSGMPYDKTAADSPGWGEGGWFLAEDWWGKLGNVFGGRSGFFLHHDGGSRGTSGCIGLKSGSDIKALKRLLTAAQEKGQESVPVEVRY